MSVPIDIFSLVLAAFVFTVPHNHPTVTSVICSSVAILTTIRRLLIRRSRLWADDGCAIFSTCILVLQVASVFLHADMACKYIIAHLFNFGIAPNLHYPASMNRSTRIAAYYLIAITFYSIIWSVRLSILFSIIRVDPNGTRRRFLLGVALVFGGTCLILIGQLFWVCERTENPWKDSATPQCPLSRQVVILQLVSDVVSDTILIVAPLQLLVYLEDNVLRRRLCIIFSMCTITTIVSLVHAVLILTGGGPDVLVAAVVEDSISLIVCNLPIVVTASMHVCSDETQTSPTSSVMQFATNVRAENIL
ncbi:hypothetical protein B0H16DRAFT_1712320 [Mycena metata]|uniref:Rhodopsin domain-containing protein n=1 Tax=Mycena metata TaxID=1033252 RepID=A0AAD7NVX4_9AGAR|nr:hypothetical protein B0H16DRAFT_1712320 [Mycena metata]